MNCYPPIFEDAETPIRELIERHGSAGWLADSTDVGMVQAGQAIDGEMWAPQLTPYVEWEWHVEDGSVQEEESHDLWRLRTGVPDELRERIAAGQKKAVQEKLAKQQAVEDAAAQVPVELSWVFGVKEGVDGLVLAKVDLREFAKHGNPGCDLVVVLPSQVGGVPVTRIAVDAFSRFNVRGIGVRLLVVPDSVVAVDARAFSSLAAEVIYVGKGCRYLGDQPLERWDLKPSIESRRYVIAEDNPWWQSREGCILSKNGADLMFLAPPYAVQEQLPDDVRRVGANALAKWDTVPEVVRCSANLGRVAFRQWDSALWLCPQDAPAFETLQKRNVRLASPDAVEVDGCWYDFDDDGAVLVAGPPAPPTASQSFARAAAHHVPSVAKATGQAGAARDAAGQGGYSQKDARGASMAGASASHHSVLALPQEVHGRRLVRIAPRALVTAPKVLVLPEGVLVVGRDNACKGTRRLLLPNGLRRIEAHSFCSRELEGVTTIPASVESIGEGCFEYSVVRFEQVGTVVHISANQLLNCFVERSEEEVAALPDGDVIARVPFDFARYDRLLCEGGSLPQRLAALVHRLSTPAGLSQEACKNLVMQLKKEADDAMAIVAREGDAASVARLVDVGFIDDDTFDAQIELLRRANRTDCVMLLMERRHDSESDSSSVKSRFAL